MNETTEKKYELRELQSKDVFPMFRIISKIGVKEFKSCLDTEEVKDAITKMANKQGNANVEAVGMAVMLDIASVVISHIADAEADIYQFLSGLSGMSRKDLESLDMVTFFEMIVDVFKKEEFKDFIGVVSKLFK